MVEAINKIINNSIVLSIVSGMITFFLTYPINNWFIKKTAKKDYFDRVNRSNMIILNTCTDFVLMEKAAEDEIFASIIKGVCIQNKIDEGYVYNVQNIRTILVKDFISMRLISDDLKKKIIYDLSKPSKLPNVNELRDYDLIEIKNNRFLPLAMLISSIMAFQVGVFIPFFSKNTIKITDANGSEKLISYGTNHMSTSQTLLSISIMLCLEILALLWMNLRKREPKSKEKITIHDKYKSERRLSE